MRHSKMIFLENEQKEDLPTGIVAHKKYSHESQTKQIAL